MYHETPHECSGFHYSLKCVWIHQGETCKSGHYYCYLKCEGEWIKFNDEVVEQVRSIRSYLIVNSFYLSKC